MVLLFGWWFSSCFILSPVFFLLLFTYLGGEGREGEGRGVEEEGRGGEEEGRGGRGEGRKRGEGREPSWEASKPPD